MPGLRRFARLSREKKSLLLSSLFFVSVTRLGLWLLPTRVVRRLAFKSLAKARVSHPVATLVWAVKAASRYVPAATCLTQALALHWLLSRSGHTSKVHLGAKKDLAGNFAAHAWVECEGQVVIGGTEMNEICAS